MDLDDASQIGSYGDLETNTSQLKWGQNSDDWDFQTTNSIGVDVDGDGLDELVYFGLAYKRQDPNKGSSIYMKLFDRRQDSNDNTKYNWELVDEFSIFMQSSTYVLDICAQESKGYVPLAAGDYDGDGKEEVAFYMPDKGGDNDANDARVMVYNFDKNDNNSYTHSELARFYVKDFTADYGQMGSGWYLPTVALSTTSIRLGDQKNASDGAAIYNTHDDLVVTVSVPNHYRDKNLDLNSITKIFSMDGGDGARQLFRYEYLPFDGGESNPRTEKNTRMNHVNSCDADLNGDGFKEIVVAGMKEYKMGTPGGSNDENRNWGSWDTSHNFVNIITYTTDGGYQMVWDKPKEVQAQPNLTYDDWVGAYEPMALCAGHYMPKSFGLTDQLCVQGVILECMNTKISGVPDKTEKKDDNTSFYYIADTLPDYDKLNFPEDEVTFRTEYVYDIKNGAEIVSGDGIWFDYCTSGRLFTGSTVDQIVMICNDRYGGNHKKLYMDLSIVSCDKNGNWTHWSYNDFY